MYLLDTDTLTYLHVGHPRVTQHLQVAHNSIIATTIITKIELLQGRFDFLLKAATGAELLRAQRLLRQTEELLAHLVIVPLDEVAAVQFEQLRTTKGMRKIGRSDLLIASIALAQKSVLVTRNLRHFRQIPGLIIENWIDE